VTEEEAAAGADHAEPQNVADPAPPPPPPRLGPRQQLPTLWAEAVAAASGIGGEASGAAAAVSTTSATSSVAYAQARRKRLEQMGGAGSAASSGRVESGGDHSLRELVAPRCRTKGEG
jgi:hypothetical protein